LTKSDDEEALVRLRAERDELMARLRPIWDAIRRIGEPAGLEDHAHGAGIWGDPLRFHRHPFADENHEHEPRSAEDGSMARR